ncbi:MAG TPA: ABC transporter ATP-binding protein [Acidimicrobiales bacterium]|jgi:ABC-2 type transport system ATP-binding protein|nr:ABC transporter ATP-binding protein [Acidimicrobiales bacterium]
MTVAALGSRSPSAPGVTGAPAVETTGLTKRLGGRTVVDRLSLSVPEGSVFGFLGPNGSGKTTTLRMLLGLVFPDAGRIRLLGEDIREASAEVLASVGALVEGPAFYPFLTGRENLERFDAVGPGGSRSDRAERIEGALHRVGLAGAAGRRFRTYSLGMRQRLALAGALVRRPRLLVLDEPTNGLDPQGTREVRALVRTLAVDGTTVLLSSHLLSEIEQVCTHAAVLREGKLVAQGSLVELGAASLPVLRVETPDPDVAVRALHQLPGIGVVRTDPDGGPGTDSVVRAELVGAAPEDVAQALVGAGVRLRAMVTDRPSLEDLFVSLTGEGFDVGE